MATSTLLAYGFAHNGQQSVIYFNSDEPAKQQDISDYFMLEPLEDFEILTVSDKWSFFTANKIFYNRVTKSIINQAQNFDIVITRNPDFLPYLHKIRKYTGCKIVYQTHNFFMKDDFKRARAVDPSHFKYEQKWVPGLDGLLCLNSSQMELYRKYVDIKMIESSPGAFQVTQPKDNFENSIVLYVGSFLPEKGIEMMLETFATLKNEKAKLILAGGRDAQEIAYAQSLSQKYGLSNKIEITGWLNYRDLAKVLSIATIGVVPMKDTFFNRYLTAPNKLFDYLSYGIPVVCSNLPSIKDFIKDGREALLIEPDNPFALSEAIDKLLTDYNLYKKLSENAPKTAEKHIFSLTTQKILDFFKNL